MRRFGGVPVVLVPALLVASISGCGGEDPTVSAPAPQVGPLRATYEGPAYPVPDGPEVDGRANVVAVLREEDGATEYLPAGTPVDVEVGADGDVARVTLGDGITATGDATSFWVMPRFVELRNLEVSVDGRATTLVESDVAYHRETTSLYDDPATPEFDGISRRSREFLACVEDSWSIGQQTFTVDLIEMGIATRDRELIEHGIIGLEWGMARPLNDKAIHELSRDCDGGETVADFGYTHHSTQWLESLGRAVYLLASSEYAGEHRETIDDVTARVQTLAAALAEPANWDYWVSQMGAEGSGQDYTHRAFMMAAGMGLASTLTDDPDDATQWATNAATIVQRGLDNQWEDGVNPELGGYDVQYQAYGIWLAQVYHSTLEPGTDLQQDVETMIDKAVTWERNRVKENGQFDTSGSSRICAEINWWSGTTSETFDPGEAVRAFLMWSQVTADSDLADVAVKAAQAHEQYGNKCPIPPEPPGA